MKYLVIEQRLPSWPHTAHDKRLEYEHEVCDTKEEAEEVAKHLKTRPQITGYRSVFIVEELS